MAAGSSDAPPSISPHGLYCSIYYTILSIHQLYTSSLHHPHSSSEFSGRKGLLSQMSQGCNSLAVTKSCDLTWANHCKQGYSALTSQVWSPGQSLGPKTVSVPLKLHWKEDGFPWGKLVSWYQRKGHRQTQQVNTTNTSDIPGFVPGSREPR